MTPFMPASYISSTTTKNWQVESVDSLACILLSKPDGQYILGNWVSVGEPFTSAGVGKKLFVSYVLFWLSMRNLKYTEATLYKYTETTLYVVFLPLYISLCKWLL